MSETVVIVGAGAAGGTAAATLREEGFDGRVVVIGAEELHPYERPPLSKEYLRGEHGTNRMFLRPSEWYEDNDIEVRTGVRAERIDPDKRTVILAGGASVQFDRALVATGARNRRIRAEGADLPGVLQLRTLAEADRIREAAGTGVRFVVVGMGFIGAEVAASLRQLGNEVTAVEALETPLHAVLGTEIGRVVEAAHRDRGVAMHLGEQVERFEGTAHLEAVVTASGRRIECEVAVVGIGVEPSVEIAAGTGLELGNGVVVGPNLQTNVPGIFAAGDVALHDHPRFGRVRVEHNDNALKMGQAAGRNLLGANEPFDDPHWFWSDQFDMNIQVAGVAASWDRVVYRGSLDERSFSAFYLAKGVLLQALSVNRPRDVRRAIPLIRAGVRPDPESLRDEDVDLRSLLPRTRARTEAP